MTGAELFETIQKQILDSIDVLLVVPLEKEALKKKLIHIGIGAVAVLIIVVSLVAAADSKSALLHRINVSEQEFIWKL